MNTIFAKLKERFMKQLVMDHLGGFAQLWLKMNFMSLWFLFFFLLGGVGWFVGLLSLRSIPEDRTTFVVICSLFSAAGFGLASLFYTGMAVASVALSTQRRLKRLERRVRRLEANAKASAG